jgi:hypothetical protein
VRWTTLQCMQNRKDIATRIVKSAVEKGEAFLLTQQSADGFWRDYLLEPGASEAWTTACVGCALVAAPTSNTSLSALRNATEILHSVGTTRGWGYNHNTATDADTTAWVFRFLASVDDQRALNSSACLQQYLAVNGAAHTFLNGDRFGAWAEAHADVSPLVGLALVAVDAVASIISKVRRASLQARQNGGGWRSFWWTTDAYATAWNLNFLAASGGIPSDVSGDTWNWLLTEPKANSPFAAAHQLMITVMLGKAQTTRGAGLLNMLLDWQLADNSWPKSSVLLVPAQWKHARSHTQGYEDPMRLMSTAMTVYALKLWLLKHKVEVLKPAIG